MIVNIVAGKSAVFECFLGRSDDSSFSKNKIQAFLLVIHRKD